MKRNEKYVEKSPLKIRNSKIFPLLFIIQRERERGEIIIILFFLNKKGFKFCEINLKFLYSGNFC
jgi:hypothetical protein